MPLLTEYPQLKTIREMARKKGVAIYIVGGFLRDYLLGQCKTDFDFAVERDALGLARVFARKIKGAFVLLDEERGCARVARKEGGQIYTFDFADFRAKTFKGDLSHRDFTINTLFVDLVSLTGTEEVGDVLRDPGNGLADLKNQKIRMTFAKTFEEDPLRMMRAFSLRANLGFQIEARTLTRIKKDKERIRDVSYERIRDELFKILESSRTGDVLKEMDRAGLLEKIMPQVKVMFHCKQGGYHHLDVWPHSLETVVQVDRMLKQPSLLEEKLSHSDVGQDLHKYLADPLGGNRSRKALIKLAALVHDIGKPDTRKKEKERVSFHGHERVGRDIVRCIAKLLKLSTQERHALEDMVLWHLRPGYLSDFQQPSQRAVYRYFRDAKEEAAGILLLSLADQQATRGPLTSEDDQRQHEKICLQLMQQFFIKRREKPFQRIISGDDLIKTLKLKPSPLFGKILGEVEEKQTLGEIKTKREALALAKKMAQPTR